MLKKIDKSCIADEAFEGIKEERTVTTIVIIKFIPPEIKTKPMKWKTWLNKSLKLFLNAAKGFIFLSVYRMTQTKTNGKRRTSIVKLKMQNTTATVEYRFSSVNEVTSILMLKARRRATVITVPSANRKVKIMPAFKILLSLLNPLNK